MKQLKRKNGTNGLRHTTTLSKCVLCLSLLLLSFSLFSFSSCGQGGDKSAGGETGSATPEEFYSFHGIGFLTPEHYKSQTVAGVVMLSHETDPLVIDNIKMFYAAEKQSIEADYNTEAAINEHLAEEYRLWDMEFHGITNYTKAEMSGVPYLSYKVSAPRGIYTIQQTVYIFFFESETVSVTFSIVPDSDASASLERAINSICILNSK